MKLAYFSGGPALANERGLVPAGDLAASMQELIEHFDELRPTLQRRLVDGHALPLETIRLLPPIVPGKILCSTSTEPLLMTLKSPDAVIGPGDTIVLPETFDPWEFFPEAELGLVMRHPGTVFGYTCVIDVMAHGGDPNFGRDNWVAKSDTLCPIGPWITTADEVPEPNGLRVRSWHNGLPAQDYSTAAHGVPELVAFATGVMTLHSGDLIACGHDPDGAKPMRAGDMVQVEIQSLGRLEVSVGA